MSRYEASLKLDLEKGVHKVFIQQLNNIDTKLWWIGILNFYLELDRIRSLGSSNTYLGYDGNHANIAFDVIVENKDITVNLELVKKNSPNKYSSSIYYIFQKSANRGIIKTENFIYDKVYHKKWMMVNSFPSIMIAIFFIVVFSIQFNSINLSCIILSLVTIIYSIIIFIINCLRKNIKEALKEDEEKAKFLKAKL